MKIETKFNINDLVVSKYQRNPLNKNNDADSLCCFEVIDINTSTCMAGTQVFYVCRSIHGAKITDYVDNKKIVKYVDFSIGANNRGEYSTMREDELIKCPQDIIDLVTNKNN